MVDNKIIVHDAFVEVVHLEIPRKDIADFFQDIHEDDRPQRFIQALEIGIFCLQRTRSSQDTDFIRRQIESLLRDVESAVKTIPEETQKALVAKLGTNDGQILAPIQMLVNGVSTTMSDRIKDVKDLLLQEIDPAKETTTLGKTLRSLRDLLDSQRNDSVQGALNTAIRNVTSEEGALAKAVKNVVEDAVKPLATEVDRLTKEVRGQQAAAEALAQTIEKGVQYEHAVVAMLQAWAQGVGAEVHHVGTDSRPGDIAIRFTSSSLVPTPLSIVVEVRDRQDASGRKIILDDLTKAMAARQAKAAIYLSRSRNGLAREVGEWAEGEGEHGRWVACTNDHLLSAIRFLVVQERLATLRATAPEIDSQSIEAQLQRVRVALGRVRNINTKVTELRRSADGVQAEAEALRDEVRSALMLIEDALRSVSAEGQVKSVA